MKCPYMSKHDPRIMMHRQVESMSKLNKILTQSLKEEHDSMAIALSKFQDPTIQAAISAQLQAFQLVKGQCLNNVAGCLATASSLDQLYNNSPVVTADVINAKNRVQALESAVSFNKNVFIAAVVQSNSYVMNQRIQNLSLQDQFNVTDYDSKVFEAVALSSNITTAYNAVVSSMTSSDPAGYLSGITALMSSTIGAQDIVSWMAMMFNVNQTSEDSVQTMITSYNNLSDVFAKSVIMTESFNNNLPNAMASTDVDALIANNDYNTVLLKTALEPEIISNHLKFASERATFDSGGGVPSVRDDDNDINPWVGLFGRPTYRHTDGSSADTVVGFNSNANADPSTMALGSYPSDNPDDLMRVNTPSWSFY